MARPSFVLVTAAILAAILLTCDSTSSKGRLFYTSFIHTIYTGGACRLYVIPSDTTRVRVYAPWVNVDMTRDMSPGQMVTFDLPSEIRTTTTSGVEKKGVYVQAYSGDVQVYALNLADSRNYQYGDVKQVLPAVWEDSGMREDGVMVLAHNSTRIRPFSTISVVAHVDNTTVHVVRREGDQVAPPQLLQRLDTYTYTAPSGGDVSGYRVTSQNGNPISVTAGHRMTSVTLFQEGHIESTFGTVASTHGKLHIMPPIQGIETHNHEIVLRVTSSAGSDVIINGSYGISETAHVNSNQVYEHRVTHAVRHSHRVLQCPGTCLVTRYVSASSSSVQFTYPSMHPLTPVTRFTNNTRFMTVRHPKNLVMHHYLGVVMETAHIPNIRLNGRRMDYLAWSPVEATPYSVVSIGLAEDLYHLWTESGSRFAAYVHGFSIQHWFGYGFEAGTGATSIA